MNIWFPMLIRINGLVFSWMKTSSHKTLEGGKKEKKKTSVASRSFERCSYFIQSGNPSCCIVSISKEETKSLRQTIDNRMTNISPLYRKSEGNDWLDGWMTSTTYLCNCPCRWWVPQHKQLIQLVVKVVVTWQTLFLSFFLKAHNFFTRFSWIKSFFFL